MTDLNHVAAMRVAQTKIHQGDLSWYVQTANNFIVRGKGKMTKAEAEAELQQIREWAYEEAQEEAANGW